MTLLQTERLRLRPLSTADTDWWVQLHTDPEVNRYLGGPYSRERAYERLLGMERQWAERGYGLCALELRETGETIGRAGLNWWEQFGETEAGWTLAREYWGQGYASEAARAVLDSGFGELGLAQITAMILHGNENSVAVARRLGFTELRQDRLYDADITVFAMTKSDWAG